jgi:hypothetical protein
LGPRFGYRATHPRTGKDSLCDKRWLVVFGFIISLDCLIVHSFV